MLPKTEQQRQQQQQQQLQRPQPQSSEQQQQHQPSRIGSPSDPTSMQHSGASEAFAQNCDQNGDRVFKSNEIYHICIMLQKSVLVKYGK